LSQFVISEDIKATFPDLKVLITKISYVNVTSSDLKLEEFKNLVIEETRRFIDFGILKDMLILRAYRDFFWRIKIDPKVRSAIEALIRRTVLGNPLYHINTSVDAYNLASIKAEVAVATLDADKLRGDLKIRLVEKDEKLLGIGMNKPLQLQGDEVVIQDSEDSKVSEATKKRLVAVLRCSRYN